MSNQTAQDLEIYLLKAQPEAIASWLAEALGELVEQPGEAGIHRWRSHNMLIVYTEKADGNFGSLWFKTNETPWGNDLECARSAHAALQTEVRCAALEWSESNEQDGPESWIKIIRGVEKTFDWN